MSDRALIVVDVQVGAFDGVRMAPLADGLQVLDRIAALIAHTRSSGAMVVFVQDDGRPGGAFEPGTPHWALHPRLAPLPADLRVRKARASAFEGTELAARLRAADIGQIAVVGLHSEGCVAATVRHGLALGFEVVLVGDAHGTAAAQASAVVAAQNRALAEQGAVIVSAARILRDAAWRGTAAPGVG